MRLLRNGNPGPTGHTINETGEKYNECDVCEDDAKEILHSGLGAVKTGQKEDQDSD